MTSTPVFYPLLLAALVLVCVIVHAWRPDPLRATQPPVKPIKPRRQRSKEPKPFAGYLQQPLCEACEHGVETRLKSPGSPPPLIIFNRGRKRTVGPRSLDRPLGLHETIPLGPIEAEDPGIQ